MPLAASTCIPCFCPDTVACYHWDKQVFFCLDGVQIRLGDVYYADVSQAGSLPGARPPAYYFLGAANAKLSTGLLPGQGCQHS